MAYTDTQLTALQTLIDAPHPTQGAYNQADYVECTRQVNAAVHHAGAYDYSAWALSGPVDASAFSDYLQTNSFRNESLYGRLAMVAFANPQAVVLDPGPSAVATWVLPELPLDDAEAGLQMDWQDLTAAKLVWHLITGQQVGAAAVLDSGAWDLAINRLGPGVSNAQVWDAAQRDAIKALSAGKRTPVDNAGLPRAREQDVIAAIALP